MLGVDFPTVLAEAQAGDTAAFERLYRDVQPPLLRYLRLTAADYAEDAAAETWVQVIKALPSFDGHETGFRSWVFTIARNKVVDWQRHSARRPTVPLSADHEERVVSPDPGQLVEDDDTSRRAIELIGQLAPDQAEAVLLRSIVGLSVSEAAAVMERSEGAVRVLSHRGLKRLATLVTSVMGGEV